MVEEHTTRGEETLDPDDWEAIRLLGHRMIDDMLDCMKGLQERPVWRPVPEGARIQFEKPLPLDPQPLEEVYEEFIEYVLPYPLGNDHPRFWGWVLGTGTPIDALADFLASAMNTNCGGGNYHSAYYVEAQVIAWIKDMLGYPSSASGVLTTGGSAANLIGLTVACNAKTEFDLRKDGWRGAAGAMVVYASQEVHSSVQKAVELMGLGSSSLHTIPVNEAFEMKLDVLRNQIAEDRAKGHLPFCVVGAAGTTNTGSFDDLNALADLCEQENLWLHIDGAFGAWAALSESAKHRVAGMQRADSLAVDLHKWMYMPVEIGCVLISDHDLHRGSFELTPAYLTHGGGGCGIAGGDQPWFSEYGPQLSRQFRALKAWMSLKTHGVKKYGRLIEQNLQQIRRFVSLIEESDELELCAPVALTVVCFRYVMADLDEEDLNRLNARIVVELQEAGKVVLSGSVIESKYVLHVANTNHRSRTEDFEVLAREVCDVGRKIAEDLNAV